MRILVVDDELVSRKKMAKIMGSIGECVAVESGHEALKLMETALEKEEPFDLITLDISMPDMDGLEVLTRARKREREINITKEKGAKVIMVTGQSEKHIIISCIKAGCNSYIVKPFDRASMAKKLEEIGLIAPGPNPEEALPVEEDQGIRKMVMDTINRFNRGEVELPVLMQISQEIESVMNHPNSGVKEVAEVLEKDAVLTLKVIATSNSALFYRGGEKVKDLRIAITRIGTNEIQRIVSTISNRNMYQTGNKQFKGLIETLWLHSLACAISSRAISIKVGDQNTDKIYLIGLIHDIGCLLLLRSIGDMTSDSMEFDREDLLGSLQEVHTSFGAAILNELGMGIEVAECVKSYKWTSFEKDTPKGVLILNLAEKIATHIGFGFFESETDLSKLESARILGLEGKTLEDLATNVLKEMKEVAGVFE